MPSLRTEGVILVIPDRTMENGDCATSPGNSSTTDTNQHSCEAPSSTQTHAQRKTNASSSHQLPSAQCSTALPRWVIHSQSCHRENSPTSSCFACLREPERLVRFKQADARLKAPRRCESAGRQQHLTTSHTFPTDPKQQILCESHMGPKAKTRR